MRFKTLILFLTIALALPQGSGLVAANQNTCSVPGTEFCLLEGHTDRVYSLAFGPDGSLASGSKDDTVRLWDVPFQRADFIGQHEGGVRAVAIAPNGRILASGSDDTTIKLWDMASGELTVTIPAHLFWVRSLAFHPLRPEFVSVSNDRYIKVWNAVSGALIREIKEHAGPVYSVAYNNNGAQMATGSWDKSIILWDGATGQRLRTLRGHSASVLSLAFSPKDDLLISGADDNTVRLWLTDTNAPAPSAIRANRPAWSCGYGSASPEPMTASVLPLALSAPRWLLQSSQQPKAE